MAAGALAAARVEQDSIVGMCLGMSGVDREADASALKASLEEWLSKEARTLDLLEGFSLTCGMLWVCDVILPTSMTTCCTGCGA